MLVNNAGIGMRTVNPRFLSKPEPFWEVTPAGFRDVVETKLVGCFLMAREVVPLMLRGGGGRIVNISMNEQTMVRRGFVPYGPAGAGVEALSRVMAAKRSSRDTPSYTRLPKSYGSNPRDVRGSSSTVREMPASLRHCLRHACPRIASQGPVDVA